MIAVPLTTQCTFENFDEDKYLSSNPDVRAAVEAGQILSGRSHFDAFGHKEGRVVRLVDARMQDLRAQKLDKLRPYLRTDISHTLRGDKLDYLSDELREATRIVDTVNVSAGDYDTPMLDIIHSLPDGLILDAGCGQRATYYGNVVNYEIVDYDTTDVLGVGEVLPFKDGTFDAVFSIAVLEHVRDPFTCAREISRVLKPGGRLLCAVPFLAPYHGYPHHYYNMTHQGIARLFEDELVVDDVEAPAAGHPAHTLHWVLNTWFRGLPPERQAEFQSKTVGELMTAWPNDTAASPIGALDAAAVQEIAHAFFLRAHKSAE